MTLDIRGSLKNTKLSSNQYVVFEELIANAIDACLIRRANDPSAPDMSIAVEVNFSRANLFGDEEVINVSCSDNGCGLGDDQLKAFLTKDTSYKDDLAISGIGKCKGAGRIQFFHHFAAMTIVSTYCEGDRCLKRKLRYAEPQKQIEVSDFSTDPGVITDIGTIIELQQFKEVVRSRMSHGDALSSLFSARVLKKQMLVAFLQRLVGLGEQLGNFEIRFTTRHWKDKEAQEDMLRLADLPAVTAKRSINVAEREPRTGDRLGTFQKFDLSHYRLEAEQYDLARNAIAFCAKSTPVKDITNRYLRTRTEQNKPVSGFHHIVLIEADYLDTRVNEQRDDFDNIPDEIPSGDLFSSEKLSYSDIHEALDPVIDEMVTPADWKKDEVLKAATDQFGISEAMLQDTKTRIVYGESAQSVAERVLSKYQKAVIDETAAIFTLKKEIIMAEPDSDEFRQKIHELSWKYTSSLKNFDMANLSQLIVRRAAIVEILDLACGRQLSMQALTDGMRRKDEEIIHNIFFPMRKDSTETTDHDIWLLSEEYQYYDYISSDLPLSNIKWNDNSNVFEGDIDDALRKVLEKRTVENRGKRPDIAVFSKEGSAIIIEFKSPGVSTDEHIGDLSEYSQLLAAKSGGKLRKFYGYLIGDSINTLRLSGNWTQFPTGKGWFLASELKDPETRQKLGETYFEILHFSDVIDRAKKRIGAYQDRLKLDLRRGNN